jgi:hypothetical protein
LEFPWKIARDAAALEKAAATGGAGEVTSCATAPGANFNFCDFIHATISHGVSSAGRSLAVNAGTWDIRHRLSSVRNSPYGARRGVVPALGMILIIIFWLLLLLWAIGGFTTLNPPLATGRNVVLIILLSILGYWATGNPIHR